MKQLVQAEWYKLQKNRTLLYLCIAITVLNIINIISSILLKKSSHTGQEGILEIGNSMNALWFGTMAGFFIASEFQNGSIRNVLSLGKNRGLVFWSKFIAMGIAIVLMLFVMAASYSIGYSLLNGFGTMPIGSFIPYFILCFFSILIFHLPYAGFFTLFAFLTKKPGLTILLAFGYEFTILSLGAMFENYPGKSLKFMLRYFPQYYYTKIGEFLGNWQFLINGYVVCTIFTLIPIVIGIYQFRKADIK